MKLFGRSHKVPGTALERRGSGRERQQCHALLSHSSTAAVLSLSSAVLERDSTAWHCFRQTGLARPTHMLQGLPGRTAPIKGFCIQSQILRWHGP
jgi:hypothetical protein